MKTPFLKSLGSKTAKTFFAIAVLTLVGVTACKKDSSSSGSTAVTEADAAQVTSDAVVPASGGMVAQTTSSVTLYAAEAPVVACSTTKDTTIAGASVAGAAFTYAYSFNWNYVLDCSAASFTENFTGSSSYSGLLSSMNGSSTGTYVLTGIGAATDYAFTGSFERKGATTSKVGQQKTFTSDLKIVSANTLVDKTTLEIVSGTATVSIVCTVSGGQTYTFGGTLTFLGNQKGTLVLNSGTSYAVSW